MKGAHTQLSQVPRQQKSSSGMHQITSSEEHVADIVHIHAVSQGLPKSYKTNVTVNGIPLQMKIDTGAAVSIISESTWKNKLKQPTLKPCSLVLKEYPDNHLHIEGCCEVQVQVGETIKQLELIVCEGNGVSLLGRNWLKEIRLDWSAIANANGTVKSKLSKLDSVLDKFKDVFTEELGHSVQESKLNYMQKKAVCLSFIAHDLYRWQ